MSAEAIQLLGADLHIGQAHAGLTCPFCRGGQRRDASLRIWRNAGGLGFRCYRLKCGRHGFVREAGAASILHSVKARSQKNSRSMKVYRGQPEPLPPEHVHFYMQRFGIPLGYLQWARVQYDADEQRHVWPILDPYLRTRGHNLRAASASWQRMPDGQEIGQGGVPVPIREPKVLTYFQTEQPRLCWYRVRNRGALVLVEDQISALRASKYVDSCALLGTELHADMAAEIARQGYPRVLLALDQDATGKTYSTIRRYGGMLPLEPLPLERDIKDMTEQRVQELLTAKEGKQCENMKS